jgi:hypothetical protein
MATTAASVALHQWLPTHGTGADILELDYRAESLDTLCTVLAGLAPRLNSCSFVLARVSVPSGGDLTEVMAATHKMDLPARVCLAIDLRLLRKIVAPIRDVDRVGLLLDDIDASTPLADIAHEAIEAVRFDTEFARRATVHLRSQCILDAMLGFALDSGLCTLGPARRGDTSDGAARQFDYVANARGPESGARTDGGRKGTRAPARSL